MKKAQNLVEYCMIIAFVALIGYMFSSNINFNSLRSYLFGRPVDSANPSQINIEAMTE